MSDTTPPTPHRDRRDRAVVLGGSIAGLLAARVLAESHQEVIVVDRDDLAAPAGPRRGTPQVRHIHGLLARGLETFEALCPGLTAELVAAGAPVGDMLARTRLCFGGHRFAQGPSGLPTLCVRRPTLEHAVRRRVAALPAVRLLGGYDVVGLVTDRPGHDVVGVRVIGRDDGSAEQELWSDLVVVATGRGSRLPVWLEQLGYPRPPRRQLSVGVGYATREVRLAPGALGDDLVVLSGPTPARPRGGGLSLVEGGRCLVTLMGMLGDHPPTDPVAFTRWAADLALEDVGRALRDAEPLGDPVPHRHPTSVWHRYDSTPMPNGLVAVGDAVCALNPIYGQGMTVAALQAVELRRQLATGPVRPGRFQRRAARLAGVAWALSTGGDLAFPEVEGPRTPATRALGRYVGRVQAGAAHDPALGRSFLRVTSMVDHPSALFRPAVLARVARHHGPRPGAPATSPAATAP